MTEVTIHRGDFLRHPQTLRWGTVSGFAPNGQPHVRLSDGQYRIFPTDSLIYRPYDQDEHVKARGLYEDLRAFRRRIGRDRFDKLARKVIRRSIDRIAS